MRRLSLWLNSHCSSADIGVFRATANLAGPDESLVESVSNGVALLDCIRRQERSSIDHIVVAGHGGTTWLLDDEYGVTTGCPRNSLQVHAHEMANACARAIVPSGGLISLAACLCSRSPAWFLRWRLGSRIGSDWGPRAYLPGGQASFSARLRDYMMWHGVRDIRVRGHRAAGHATALALLAEHRGDGSAVASTPCETLFQRALPGINPTLITRRWWVRHVTGPLARRWLLGDDTVCDDIRALWDNRR